MVAAKLIKTKSIFYKSLLKLFNSAYRMADCLIVLGRDMRKILAEKSSLELEKIVIIPNWADTENIFPMRLQIKGPIVIQFAGNFGRVQGILPFLQSFYQADNQDVNVNLIGDGALRNEIGSYIYSNGQSNVKILPSFKRSQQKQILNECDIGLVTLAEGMMGLGVPSKSYNIMAAGKPILYIGDKDSEISLMIEEEGIGWTFQAFGSDLKRFLKELNQSHRPEINKMGDKAREVAIRRFSKKAILEEIIQTIDSI
jgi:glycosyltransferase involved in cell wall biosynthesis